MGQTKYTGMFIEPYYGGYIYTKNGVIETGWQSIEGYWHYFDPVTYKAVSGSLKLDGITYEFEHNGKLKSGVWANVVTGLRYYYGPSYYWQKWQYIGGEWYYFRQGVALVGYNEVIDMDQSDLYRWFDFGTDGRAQSMPYDGLYEINGALYYLVDGVSQVGLYKIDGDYYFFTSGGSPSGAAIRNQENYYAWETHCDLPCSNYTFGADGKMVQGLVQKSDGLYYYVNGKTAAGGLYKIGEDYYFVNSSGKCVTGKYYAWATYCDLPCADYEFGADGKMLRGLVQKDDGLYYYINGQLKPGLHKVGEDYYFVNSAGKCITNIVYDTWGTSYCDLPNGKYEFGADGKMLRGAVVKADGVYYYVNGKVLTKAAGLYKLGNDYYLVDANGKCAVGVANATVTYCDLAVGSYEFGADGAMLQGVVVREDGAYYYVNGNIDRNFAGLHQMGDDYYFISQTGKVSAGRHYVYATFCDLPAGIYEFDATGKLLQGLVQKTDGLYYYVNGRIDPTAAGLRKIGEDYYFVSNTGKCVTGICDAYATHCDLPAGIYEFGTDGKMLDGFVVKNGNTYYYVNGNIAAAGLYQIDGAYYCIDAEGVRATGVQTVTATYCDLAIGTYEFGADGKIVNGIVKKSDGIYCYVNGNYGSEGIHYVDGYYYYVIASGKVLTNQTFYVAKTNGLIKEGNYQINANGQLVRIIE